MPKVKGTTQKTVISKPKIRRCDKAKQARIKRVEKALEINLPACSNLFVADDKTIHANRVFPLRGTFCVTVTPKGKVTRTKDCWRPEEVTTKDGFIIFDDKPIRGCYGYTAVQNTTISQDKLKKARAIILK